MSFILNLNSVPIWKAQTVSSQRRLLPQNSFVPDGKLTYAIRKEESHGCGKLSDLTWDDP